jgi:hypothetical protein
VGLECAAWPRAEGEGGARREKSVKNAKGEKSVRSEQGAESPEEGVRLTRADAGLALALGLAAAAGVALTVRSVGLTWDEPKYFAAAGDLRILAALLIGRDLGHDAPRHLTRAAFSQFWGYEALGNQHPPMGGYLLNASWFLFHRWMHEAWAYRFSSAVLFGLLIALLYLESAHAWGRPAGVAAAVSLALMPRVFGHAHIAATDTPSMFFWFLCWVAARRLRPVGQVGPVRQVGRVFVFGLVLGLSLLVKFTNWLVVVPLAAWVVWRRRSVRWTWILVAGLIAFAVALALNPGWWFKPHAQVYRFIENSLTRDRLQVIPTYFLGRPYDFSLPWYNAPVLTAATTPVVILLFFLLGSARELNRRRRTDLGFFSVATIVFFWIARALPSAPGHDGIRLFLPAFPFVAALAGSGLAATARWAAACRGRVAERGSKEAIPQDLPHASMPDAIGSHTIGIPRTRPGTWRPGLALLAVLAVSAGYQVVRQHPHYLAYYGEAVGGPAGAQRLGFETTYWWDAATLGFIDDLNRRLPPDAAVYCLPRCPPLEYWQTQGRLRADIRFVKDPKEIQFLILLCRQGMFDPAYEYRSGTRRLLRPPGYTAETIWHWCHQWKWEHQAVATRGDVPLLIVVDHGRGGALLN